MWTKHGTYARYEAGTICWNECDAIERNPDRMRGAWRFKGTGVPLAHPSMRQPPSATPADSSPTEPSPPWSPVFAYNNLPAVPREQLTTPAVEARCELTTAALETLREATGRFSDPDTLFRTVALVEAQASSAIEGIVTTVSQMLEYIGKPRLSDGHDPDADDALRHHESIVDACQRRGAEPVGTAMAIRACSTTKGRRMPVRRGRGTVIAGPRGIIYTPPTGEERIRSMLDELWSFMRDDGGTHPLVRMAAGHQFESIHPFADGNGRTGRLINLLYLTERKLTNLPILCHSRYILRNRPTYYRLLNSTRKSGDWAVDPLDAGRRAGDRRVDRAQPGTPGHHRRTSHRAVPRSEAAGNDDERHHPVRMHPTLLPVDGPGRRAAHGEAGGGARDAAADRRRRNPPGMAGPHPGAVRQPRDPGAVDRQVNTIRTRTRRMHDETKERMRKDRDTTKRAECFCRLVLADREDHDGRKLLDYAERTADRLPMQWEKTIA
ncbi:MAG: Fic family protein, partial [Gammaproteobacteria bacterium]|nr:Fic family protein [Gammaproteobacteria bacterium]